MGGGTATCRGTRTAHPESREARRSPARWLLPLAIAGLTTACSTPRFAGEWAYAKTCDRGHFVSLHLEQSGASVTGDWSAGTLLRGNDGQLQGRVRGNRLYVRYCSDDGGVGYQACPAFGPEDDYFTVEKGMLLRHQRFGAGFAPDIALQAAPAGKEVALDQNCYDDAPR
jgi:hypothetical protein